MNESKKTTSGLKLEQQLELRVFQEKIKNLTREQTQELFRQMMLKDNLIKTLFFKQL